MQEADVIEALRWAAGQLRKQLEAPLKVMVEGSEFVPLNVGAGRVLLAAAETLLERVDQIEEHRRRLTPEQTRLREILLSLGS